MKERVNTFRDAITAFINERRDAKLKTTKEDQAEKTAAKYEYSVWLADAARRAPQIQAVTHVLKATHPDARGTSLYVDPVNLMAHKEIGSHTLGESKVDDVVGNAAALDVYKFLKLEIDGKQLLDWLQSGDEELLEALSENREVAETWTAAFTGLIRQPDSLISHPMAKQLYWCVSEEPCDDAGYHLLQPLFSSSLTHAVHENIQSARFGENNKTARQAKRENKPSDVVYQDYRNLAVRKLGGTKPQNISQLNSERGGVNYLLSSLPPSWDLTRQSPPMFEDSIFSRFRRHEGVNHQLHQLFSLLKNQPKPAMETRREREEIERKIGASLASFGLDIRALSQPGWTRDPVCKRPLCEQLWLDPERIELPLREDHLEEDQAFIDAYHWGDWPDEVAHRFAGWLNAFLRDQGLPMGDVEHAHWAKQALIDVLWPIPMKRRAVQSKTQEVDHV